MDIQTQRVQRQRKFNIPLEEYEVFSNSEDESDYVQRAFRDLPHRDFSVIKRNMSIQCDIDIQLSDISKILSTYDFENATKSEVNELLSVLDKISMNCRNGINKPKFNPSQHLKKRKTTSGAVNSLVIDPILSTNKCRKVKKSSSLCNRVDKQTQKVELHKVQNTPLDEYVVFSDSEDENEYVLRVVHNLPICDFISNKCNMSIQCNILPDIKLSEIWKLLSTYDFENSAKCELQRFVNILYQIALDNIPVMSESDVDSSQNSKKRKTTSGAANSLEIEPTSSNNRCRKAKKSTGQGNDLGTLTSQESNGNHSLRSLNKLGNSKIMSKSKTKLLIGNKQKNTPKCNQKPDSEILKQPLKIVDSSMEKIRKRGHSLFCHKTENQFEINKPHFVSFQSHLKMRTLHSPSKWLQSPEFQQYSQSIL